MAAKRKAAPIPRIAAGSYSCRWESVGSVVEHLMTSHGFRLEDLKHAEINLDYSGCYYESDSPGICVEWHDIH